MVDGLDNQLLPNAIPALIAEWGQPRAAFTTALAIGPFGMMIGGLLGFLLGCGLSVGLTMLINTLTTGTKWPIVISMQAAVIAILFAGAVGIFFGFYPARRASMLDPIEALRYE